MYNLNILSMSSTSETGHAKNVANFEKLLAEVKVLGKSYNPSRENLKLAALDTQLTAAKTAITTMNTSESTYKNAISARDAALKSFGKLVTRINNALKASDTLVEQDEKATALVRKLQGRRASAKKTEEEIKLAAEQGKEIVQVSASQMSFDNRIENFSKLINLISSIPAYSPNEPELKVAALTSFYNDLKAKNLAVVNAEASLNLARIARNEALYKENIGLLDISVDVKNYIKSIFGANSPQYKNIGGFKFTSIN